RPQALALNSLLGGDGLRQAMHRLSTGQIRLVYVAPERLRQSAFVEALARIGVARLVVGEAHCVSIWGHDFRPDYLHLRQVHRDLGLPPLLAMTATAPPKVRADIERQLVGSAGAMRVLAADTFRP
ncbi:MAG: DEAD/DEAH box helicase, partial [Caldilinea sp.]